MTLREKILKTFNVTIREINTHGGPEKFFEKYPVGGVYYGEEAALRDESGKFMGTQYDLDTLNEIKKYSKNKLLVCAAMICLVETGMIPSWVVITIISREFIISGFRLIASDNGIVIAASYWGKFKTVFQMVMIIMMIADIAALSLVTQIVMWIALALTIVSLIDYLKKNWHVMGEQK